MTTWLKMTRFWGRLFLINFALGIVTGITMEFQFGMNWAEYSRYVGDIFGAPLAIEATLAFFLESVFIGVWVFGWEKISPRMHVASIWLVAIATNLSALWILLANGWMQQPVGYHLVTGAAGQVRAEMIDFVALLLNPYGLDQILPYRRPPVMPSAAFFVMGISAWHLLRKNEQTLLHAVVPRRRSFRAGELPAGCGQTGDFHAVEIAKCPADQIGRDGIGLGDQARRSHGADPAARRGRGAQRSSPGSASRRLDQPSRLP